MLSSVLLLQQCGHNWTCSERGSGHGLRLRLGNTGIAQLQDVRLWLDGRVLFPGAVCRERTSGECCGGREGVFLGVFLVPGG